MNRSGCARIGFLLVRTKHIICPDPSDAVLKGKEVVSYTKLEARHCPVNKISYGDATTAYHS